MIGREQSSRRSEPLDLTDITGVVDAVKNIRGKASEQASVFSHALTQTFREHSQSLINEQKTRAATEMRHLGTAVRSAGERLQDQDSTALARYFSTAAEGLNGMAHYVEELELADLGREVESFARQRPALLIGGMFLAGLGIARFIKAGQEPARSQAPRSAGGRANGKRSRKRKSRSE